MSKQGYLLSVIVPVFNNATFIGKTLRSIFQQIDACVEVIIINDGSTDDTDAIIRDILDNCPNTGTTTYLTQTNRGVSASRNIGLAHAVGEYIAFVDGDDLWSPYFWQTIKPLLLGNPSDLIEFYYQKFTDVPVGEHQEIRSPACINVDPSQPELLYDVFALSHWHVWSRVYQRNLIAGHTFIEGRRYEDMMFTPYCYMKAKRVTRINATLYFYRDNPNGITRNIRLSDIDDIVYAMECILNYAKNKATPEINASLTPLMLINCFNEIRHLHNKIYGFYNYNPRIAHIFVESSKFVPYSKMTLKNKLHLSNPLLWKKLSQVRAKIRK